MKLTMGCTTRPYAGLSFEDACQRIAAAGYTDVALFTQAGVGSQSTPAEVRQAREVARDAGLRPSMLLGRTQLEAGPEAALADYRRLIDNAALLGASWLLSTGTMQPDQYEVFFDLMQAAAPLAEDAGIGIALKPHGGITLTTDDLIAANQRIPHPSFGICYDPGNIIYYTKGAERPETHVARVAPYVTTGIIKDCALAGGKPDVMVTAGEGLVDFTAVLSGLVAGGFRGPLYVECVGGQSLEEIDRNVVGTRSFIEAILSRIEV